MLLIVIYQKRDKGAYFNNLFKPMDVPKFKEDDERNNTHPNEYVKLGISYKTRGEAVSEVKRLKELYKNMGSKEEIDKLIGLD